MFRKVFHRYRMGSYYYLYSIPGFNKLSEGFYSWAWGVSNDQPRCKMNNLRSVSYHFFRYIFNVATGASTAI